MTTIENNCLITKSGRIIECNGQPHDRIVNLPAFFNGGVRVKLWQDKLCVESGKALTAKQSQIIRFILTDNFIYETVTCIAGIYKEKKQFDVRIRRL